MDDYDYFASIRPSPIPNRGIAFPNAFKSKVEHPDYVGKFTLADGRVVKAGIYKNTSKFGKEFLTFSLEEDNKNGA